MRYPLYFLIFFHITFFNSVKAQSDIYEYHRRNEKLEHIGKCDSNVILIVRKKKSEIVGKFADSLIYEKLPGKNRWNVVGIYKDNFIYKNHPFRNRRVCIGKYIDGFIYKKEFGSTFNIIGAYQGPDYVGPAAAMILLLKK